MSPSYVIFVLLFILAVNCTRTHRSSRHNEEQSIGNIVTSEDPRMGPLAFYRDRIVNPNMMASTSKTTQSKSSIVSSLREPTTAVDTDERSLSSSGEWFFERIPSALETNFLTAVEAKASEYQTTTATITITKLSWTVANNSEALRLGMRTALSNILDINIDLIQRGIIVDSQFPGLAGFTVYYRITSKYTALQIDQILSTLSNVQEFDTTFTSVAIANGFPSEDLSGVELFMITTQTEQPTAAPSAMPTTAQPTPNPTAKPTALPTLYPSPVPSLPPSAMPSAVPTPEPSNNYESITKVSLTLSLSNLPTVSEQGLFSTSPVLQLSFREALATLFDTNCNMIGNLTVSDESGDGNAVISTYAETKYTALIMLNMMIQESQQLIKSFATDAAINGYMGDATALNNIRITTYSAITLEPTASPTVRPTALPSPSPTFIPSPFPTVAPSVSPSWSPTLIPSPIPTPYPTFRFQQTTSVYLTFANISSRTFQSSSVLLTTLKQELATTLELPIVDIGNMTVAPELSAPNEL